MTNRKGTSDHSHITLRLPADDLEALRVRAEEEDRSISAEVRRAVVAYLRAEGNAVPASEEAA